MKGFHTSDAVCCYHSFVLNPFWLILFSQRYFPDLPWSGLSLWIYLPAGLTRSFFLTLVCPPACLSARCLAISLSCLPEFIPVCLVLFESALYTSVVKRGGWEGEEGLGGVSIALTRSAKTHPSLPWLCPCSPPPVSFLSLFLCSLLWRNADFLHSPPVSPLLPPGSEKQHSLPLHRRQWYTHPNPASSTHISAEQRQLALL